PVEFKPGDRDGPLILLLRDIVVPGASPGPSGVARWRYRTTGAIPPFRAGWPPAHRARRSRIRLPVGHWPAILRAGLQTPRCRGLPRENRAKRPLRFGE